MSDDRQECLRILNDAIAFEEEGMRFFLEREETSPSAVERNIFHSLAKDEAGHRAYLVTVRDKLTEGMDPNDMEADEDHARKAKEIFAAALDEAEEELPLAEGELDVLRGALKVEERGYKMYKDGAASVESPQAKSIFEDLARQEQEHYRLLKNTLDYLADPAGFAAFDEGAMMDGG